MNKAQVNHGIKVAKLLAKDMYEHSSQYMSDADIKALEPQPGESTQDWSIRWNKAMQPVNPKQENIFIYLLDYIKMQGAFAYLAISLILMFLLLHAF